METAYFILVIVLFFLAFSDLIVGVSNDAVNFLNSAVGARTASFKVIIAVAGLGILVGATFSSGMMEVARKGIFNPQFFYFSEIIILFLAVMITDVILLDVFNTYGMPTSTTVSIVFELLGAAVAIAFIKVYTDPDALHLYEYINSAKALAIISGILLSVVIAFSAGVIFQYFSRLVFSFDYEKRFRYFGSLWGGFAIAAITYFMLIKGAKGASFLTPQATEFIANNTLAILLGSFVGTTVIMQVVSWFTKIDILKFIVLVGTFALAMAFAGNDLVNFIGVPLAGLSSYQLYMETGGAQADNYLMEGLAGSVPTPTLILLGAGLVMVITLYRSKKAHSVVKTSIDLGRQDLGYERFSSSLLSRSIVRNFANFTTYVNDLLPGKFQQAVTKQFDHSPFIQKQEKLGKEAPSFDMIRASVTLVVSSILIALGTSMKLPLSTTYVTFMVFMGTSLADGAWGRESAVYRVTGVLSVVGGWFFTAFSAFSAAFILAFIFYYGGFVAIAVMMVVAAILIYRTHKYHDQRLEEQLEYERSMDQEILTRDKIIELNINHLTTFMGQFSQILDENLEGLANENLNKLNASFKKLNKSFKKIEKSRQKAYKHLDRVPDDQFELGHMYVLVIDYLEEMAHHVLDIVKSSRSHVDNSHKPFLPVQIEELESIQEKLKSQFDSIIDAYSELDEREVSKILDNQNSIFKTIRSLRKNQIKRIKAHEIGTRNSNLFFHHLSEYRNLVLFSTRIASILEDLVLNPVEEGEV